MNERSTPRAPRRTNVRTPFRTATLIVVASLLGWLVVAGIGGTSTHQPPVMNAPDIVRIPIVKAHDPSDPPDAAAFSHWAHNDFQCYNCHASVFPMARVGFTHEDMDQGRFCGSCHDGRFAWAPDGRGVDCETCHVPTTEEQEIDDDDLFD